jgi:hypothetical protein
MSKTSKPGKLRTQAQPGNQPAANTEALVRTIRDGQAKIDAKQGEAVPLLLTQARHLSSLRRIAPAKGWTELVERAGVNRRVARRYLAVARAAWLPPAGLPPSVILGRLPADVEKLEHLARLNETQLTSLLTKMDPRSMLRPDVARAVKEALGQPPRPQKKGAATGRALERTVARLRTVAGHALDAIEKPEEKAALMSNLKQQFDDLLADLSQVAEAA